jgi:hypothetical protein
MPENWCVEVQERYVQSRALLLDWYAVDEDSIEHRVAFLQRLEPELDQIIWLVTNQARTDWGNVQIHLAKKHFPIRYRFWAACEWALFFFEDIAFKALGRFVHRSALAQGVLDNVWTMLADAKTKEGLRNIDPY